jgi:hypothetical protein
MPRKRSVQEMTQDKKKPSGHSVPRKKQARSGRATATTKAGGPKKRTGTQRKTAAEIAARNAEIAKLREVNLMPWEEIAEKYKIDVKTARRGYDDHLAARYHEASFERALSEMREYVGVIQASRRALSQVIHDLPVEGEEADAEAVKVETRARIAAIHEQSELIFKEIAIRQAVGDLPADFSEMTAHQDFTAIMGEVLALLKEEGVSREVFAKIEAIIDGRMNVEVPKMHLSATG